LIVVAKKSRAQTVQRKCDCSGLARVGVMEATIIALGAKVYPIRSSSMEIKTKDTSGLPWLWVRGFNTPV
jgi:hypothetical protein